MTTAPPAAGNEIARVRARATLELLPATVLFVQEAVALLGLPGDDAQRLGVVVEEACLNVVKHAFEPGEEGFFEVVLERRPRQIVVAVEDQGLPFDVRKVGAGARSGLGSVLMRAFADEVSFLNLGRRGKRVEMVKNLPSREVGELLTDEDRRLSRAEPPRAPDDVPLTLRLMLAEEQEAVSLARCVYRSYGYSYINDLLYFPDKTLEMLRSGLMTSCVAVAPDGEVVGHLALTREHPNDPVADSGKAVVDPRFRGRHLFETMKGFLTDHARQQGMVGLYSEAVTVHPYTQKGNLAVGAHETGYLLAFVPDSVLFKRIEGGRQSQRQTACLFYLRVNQEPEREVFPPPHHTAMVARIYAEGGLRRLVSAASAPAELPAHARVDLKVLPDMRLAYLRVGGHGADLKDVVRFHLHELCLQRMDCIYLDLPLGDPHTAHQAAPLESLGFCFSGVIPELDAGDVLRLQYLNNVAFDPAKTTTVSAFAKELYGYVLGELARATARQ